MMRSDFALSASVIICGKAEGTTCQDKPNLSLSQPHGPSLPPSDSFLQKWAISSWESQEIWNDTASSNLNCGPASSAVKVKPSISKATTMTEPGSLPWTS